MSDDPKAQLRKTLNLPKTKFSMKANLLQMEPRFQKRWEKLDVYNRMRALPHPKGPLRVHDGPPYANGKIHMGHLLNKVLKDFVVRAHLMSGHDVDFVPGWDCHGLPIEHQVMKELGDKAKTLAVPQIRKRCQDYAEKFVKIQSKQMQQAGTIGHYDNPYLTMKPQFEADTLEVFASLVERGLVYRDLKPVHWSIANQTALADAELEYADRTDTSVYVNFEVTSGTLPASLNAPTDAPVHLMIWTTTPWTLPANLAVAAAESETYGLYAYEKNGKTTHTLFGKALAEKVLERGEATSIRELGTCAGSELTDLRYSHPFVDRTGPVVCADYVTMEDGTGLVHTAPGHGEEDYRTGLKHGLDIYCPVRGDGTYDDTVPEWLKGQDVWVANKKVTEHLRDSGHLFYDHEFDHSYPHDWRSKTPTIFRATEQWFIAVDRSGNNQDKSLRDMALHATDNVIKFTPAWGQARLRGMLEARPDWCISRQRAWGLPIPAFLCEGEETLLTARSVRAVIDQVRKHGSDIWFKSEPSALLETYDLAADPDAPAWLKADGGFSKLRKATDIFDVWFESGSSWNAVMRARDIGYPADFYIEGSDQHRGWFQLSLLPALGVTGEPPFKRLLTHGFIVDAKGHKMSKSLGNAIGVDELLKKHGADVCRWWICSANYANDIKADWAFFQTASEEYRKVRNTLRFLLGNLSDFDPQQHTYSFSKEDDASIDAWVLAELDGITETVTAAYASCQYRRIRDAIFNFCNDTLSTVYMAAIKDRLYCEAPDSPKRRRSQTALHEIADTLIRLLAPVLCHTADEAYLSLYREVADESDNSVHFQTLPESKNRKAHAAWQPVMDIRTASLKAVEEAKATGIQNPLDAGIRAQAPDAETLQEHVPELVDLCGVSRFQLATGSEITIQVDDLREEPKCDRSWKRDETVSQRDSGLWLSERDADVLKQLSI